MNKMNFKILTLCKFAVLFFTIAGFSLHAQDSTEYQKSHTLDDIVVTANKLDTKIKDASTKVLVLSSKEIENSNGTRLPDILKSSSSIFIKSYGLTPALQTISLNGLGPEHTLILIDGVRMNTFQNSHVDLSLIPKESIDRIEIINNGVSSIYGSDAIGGVINVISKNRSLSANGNNYMMDASVTTGSFNTRGYGFGYYHQANNFNARVHYNSETSDGDFKYFFDNGIEETIKERENGAYKLNDIGLNSQYLFNEFNRVRFISGYSYQDKNVPGIETGTPSPLTKQLDKNWNNILIFESFLSDELTLKTNFNFQNNYTKYTVEPFINSYYKNLIYTASPELKFQKDNFGITTGYNFSHAALKSNEVKNGTQRNQHALFLSSAYSPAGWLKLFPSIRYDHITDIDENALTYKLGFNLQPFSEINLSLRGNAGRNFRSPSFNDLYWINSGNSELQPENSFNWEAGILYSSSNFINWQIDIAYTQIKATDKIVWTPGARGIWSPQNIAESISKIISVSTTLDKRIDEHFDLSINAGMQFLNSKKISETYPGDPSKNKFIPYIPLESANVNLSVGLYFTEINLFYKHTGSRFSDFANKRDLAPVNTVDGNIGFKLVLFNIQSKIKLEVNNIFDARYEIISGYPMPLRNYRLTILFNY